MPMRKIAGQYVLCVANEGYPASLEVRKIYRRLADPKSDALGLVRVIDESGEDYLYLAKYFIPIHVPRLATRVFASSSTGKRLYAARPRARRRALSKAGK
jgi:hypothetical protein